MSVRWHRGKLNHPSRCLYNTKRHLSLCVGFDGLVHLCWNDSEDDESEDDGVSLMRNIHCKKKKKKRQGFILDEEEAKEIKREENCWMYWRVDRVVKLPIKYTWVH